MGEINRHNSQTINLKNNLIAYPDSGIIDPCYEIT